jgi:hypothetical protein
LRFARGADEESGTLGDTDMSKARSVRKQRMTSRSQPKVTIESAYSYFQGAPGQPGRSEDTEKAVRACAYLLEFASNGGNVEIDPCLAVGISKALEFCAQRVREDREYEEKDS